MTVSVLIVERDSPRATVTGQRLLRCGGRPTERILLDVSDVTVRTDRGNQIGKIRIGLDTFTRAEGLPTIIDTGFDVDRLRNLGAGAQCYRHFVVQRIGREGDEFAVTADAVPCSDEAVTVVPTGSALRCSAHHHLGGRSDVVAVIDGLAERPALEEPCARA
ncbi:hypothetical protein B2J88_51200 [Rhodococcus sp. SRB_17]|nr:hypothetical protein [Rhodococcus sp. SRB_17]